MNEISVEIDNNLTAEEVVKVRIESGWDANIEEWQQCLAQNLVNVSARNQNGEVIGVGFLTGNVRHAEITDLVVLPDYRQHDIGSRMLDLICDYAKEHNIRYLGLTYDKSSPWLKDFYEKHGFRSIDFAMWHKSSLK